MHTMEHCLICIFYTMAAKLHKQHDLYPEEIQELILLKILCHKTCILTYKKCTQIHVVEPCLI